MKKEERKKYYTIQIIGDIALLKFKDKLPEEKKIEIANDIKKQIPRIKTVCELERIEGEFRKPKLKILVGNDTKTIHKEHGILYEIDVSKVMFSKGNLYERKRLAGLVKENEIIVDMFAGIGYFSLGIAKYAKPKIIYAIEKNPKAFELLKKNIELNKVEDKIFPILGDCREVAKQKELQNIANRVIMGYLKNTQEFLPYAFLFLGNEGIVHFHNTYKKEELWEKPIEELKDYAIKNNYKLVEVINKRIVKSYSPKVFHVVIDAKFSKLG
ncbi:MAG: class I SAM-dependent methyltransferase family protein [Candidatus Aenigmatarchaeota archaeon]